MNISVKATIQEKLSAKAKGLVSRGVKAVEVDNDGHLIFTLTDNSTVDLGALGIITAHSVKYQSGSSGTEAPAGEWSDSVPTVAQGSYLWTKTVTTYADGETTTAYSVSRIGMDGTGSVVTVNGVSPNADGNAQLAPSDIGAAAAAHGHSISDTQGLSTALTGKADAAHCHEMTDIEGLSTALTAKQDTLGAGDVTETMLADGAVASGKIGAKAILKEKLADNATNTTATVTLAVASWADNAQTVNVESMTAGKVCIVTPAPSSYIAYNEAGARATVQGDGTLTFACEDVPTEALTVNVAMLT